MEGLLLFVFVLFVGYTFSPTQADDVITQVEITNIPPEVGSIVISSLLFGDGELYPTEIIPNAGEYKIIYISGLVSDANGGEDIMPKGKDGGGKVEVVFYRSGAVDGDACVADKNYCYKASSSSKGSNEPNCFLRLEVDNSVAYSCEIVLAYFIVPFVG